MAANGEVVAVRLRLFGVVQWNRRESVNRDVPLPYLVGRLEQSKLAGQTLAGERYALTLGSVQWEWRWVPSHAVKVPPIDPQTGGPLPVLRATSGPPVSGTLSVSAGDISRKGAFTPSRAVGKPRLLPAAVTSRS